MRMKQLDALRAIAVGLVMVEHFGGATLNAFIPIGAGSVGVGCFFTLSGFLITGILLKDFDTRPGEKGAVWRDFYARRVLRLMPAYYAVLLALVLLNIEPIASSWPWHAAYLSNVWIALGNPSNVFWSLAVEEQFYLLWPFAIAFVPRAKLGQVILGMVCLTVLFRLGVFLSGYDTRVATQLLFGNFTLLAAGCLLALVSYRNGRPNRFEWYEGRNGRVFDAVALGAVALAVLSWAGFGESSLVRYFTNDLLCGTFYAWLVLLAARGMTGALGRMLDNAALQYMGVISYGLYLVHNWMPDIVEKFFGVLPKYQAGPIVLILTFGICMLSWHLFEKPILSLKALFHGHRPMPRDPETEAALRIR